MADQQKPTYIHPTAEVHPNAVIGYGCTIWGGTRIGPNAIIGHSVSIGRNCEVDCIVGNYVKIQALAFLCHGVNIGHWCFIGPKACFTNDAFPRSWGEFSIRLAQKIISKITRCDRYGPHERFRETVVEVGASIGANSTIVCGNVIGEYAMVGAGSVVTKDVKPWHLVHGNPARHIRMVPRDIGGSVEVQP